MSTLQRAIRRLEFGDWVLGLTGLTSIAIGIADFVGWLNLSTEQLLQMAIVGLGLIMSTIVIQTKRQETGLVDLELELQKWVGGRLDARIFSRPERGVEYLADKVSTARTSIDHASVSPPIPRWYNTASKFEQAVQDVARSNQVKIRYIANFADNRRKQRVINILSDPTVNRYFATSIDLGACSVHMMNFVIIDSEEIILAIPGFGEQDTFITIKNVDIVGAYAQYFNLLWSKATPFDRTSLTNQERN